MCLQGGRGREGRGGEERGGEEGGKWNRFYSTYISLALHSNLLSFSIIITPASNFLSILQQYTVVSAMCH